MSAGTLMATARSLVRSRPDSTTDKLAEAKNYREGYREKLSI